MSGAAGEATLRLFVALELPDATRHAVSAWARDELARDERLRLVADEALHVTLCFLGATAPSEVEAIGVACREAAAGQRPPRLSLGHAFVLPRRRPRVVAVDVRGEGDAGDRDPRAGPGPGPSDVRDPAAGPGPDAARDPAAGPGPSDARDPVALGDLQAALSARLAAGGWYRPEPRPFLAHLTVARVRSRSRIDARALEQLRPIDAPVFTADAVTVFRSRTRPTGARYEALIRADLAAAS